MSCRTFPLVYHSPSSNHTLQIVTALECYLSALIAQGGAAARVPRD